MRMHLEKADAEGTPCYLENSKPRNTPIYEHFGFVGRGHLLDHVKGAPPLLAMWRDVGQQVQHPAPAPADGEQVLLAPAA